MAGYAAYYCERLNDGIEECAKLFDRKEDAIAWMNKLMGFPANLTFRLFELGKEIPLTQESIETPQPPITKSKITIRE